MPSIYQLKNVKFNPVAMDYLLKQPEGPVGRSLSRRGTRILAAARRQVGTDTGRLKASLRMTHGRSIRGQFIMVGSQLDYALMHHQGTRPHIITPTRSQVMVFANRGRVIYTTQVNHPGTRANRYLTDNLYLALKD
jgi:hypothetical protein